MPLIYGSFLAGALLSFAMPVTLLICFATFFYRQAHRQTSPTEIPGIVSETPASPEQPLPNQ